MTNTVKNTLIRIANWIITIAAYGYLLYLLITFDGYDRLVHYYRNANLYTWMELGAVMVLMPLNLLLEAWKWKSLLHQIEPMSIYQAFRQVLIGLIGAFITPGRLGEYPTRVLSIPDQTKWPKAIGMGFIGSGALFATNIIFGLIALVWLGIEAWSVLPSWLVSIACIIAIGAIVLLGFFQEGNSVGIMGLCLLRYLVFSLQWWLMMRFVGISLCPDQLLLIPLYYMLVTLVPIMPAADPAVKGAISTLVFAQVTNDTTVVAMASILLWVINTVLPMCLGTFLAKSTIMTEKD